MINSKPKQYRIKPGAKPLYVPLVGTVCHVGMEGDPQFDRFVSVLASDCNGVFGKTVGAPHHSTFAGRPQGQERRHFEAYCYKFHQSEEVPQ